MRGDPRPTGVVTEIWRKCIQRYIKQGLARRDEVTSLRRKLEIEERLPPPERRCKGKAIPLQAWTDPEGSRRLRLPDFKTVGT